MNVHKNARMTRFGRPQSVHRIRQEPSRPSAPATSRRGPTPQGPTARPSASSRPRSREWLYAKSYNSSANRTADMPHWIHWYNLHRPHGGINASTPATRMNNLLGNDS